MKIHWLAIVFMCFYMSSYGAESSSRPNIVHIGLGWTGIGDLGCFGSSIPTPNIDALAATGVRFTRFTTSPIDFFAHAENFTGHSVWSFIYDDHPQQHRPVEIALPQPLLRDAGYHLYFGVGGWQAQRRDLDRLLGEKSDFLIRYPSVEKELSKWDGSKPLYINWSSGITCAYTGRVNQALSDEQIAVMQALFAKAKPFDIAAQIYARQQELGLYPDNKGWTNPFEGKVFPEDRKYDMVAYRDSNTIGEMYATYAAILQWLDREIGMLIVWLKERNQYENTLFILSGESGAHNGHNKHGLWSQVSSTPFIGETRTALAGARICPLIVAWPGRLKEAKIYKHFTSSLDLVPTILDAAAVKYPEKDSKGGRVLPLSGRSLLPVLNGVLEPQSNYYCTAGRGGFIGIYGERWSAWAPLKAEQPALNEWHLYDLSADPFERVNVAAKHPEVIDELFKHWQEWEVRHTILHPWLWPEKQLNVERLNMLREEKAKLKKSE